MRTVTALAIVLISVTSAWAAEVVWPERDWVPAAPKSQGMSEAGLDAAAAYARKYGGGSGCVIRHGYLIKEWGDRENLADIKSCTKGSIGATLLGLAIGDGLVKLDDLAQAHYPDIGHEPRETLAAGWLGQITVRHLATMTAGFDDGRPPKLVYRPGTRGIYSNDTSNMLAELLTLKFKEDLSSVFKRRVMDVIRAAPEDWTWRDNQFRPKSIGRLKTREFASGIRIRHRALARIGYLYLRRGQWQDKRVLSEEFIRTATTPTDLPAPFSYYAFYWASNQRGTYKGMPKDTFWALGLGDSFVVVCPSLDLVAVRLGTGSTKSQLPGGDDDWGARVEGFFKIVVGAVQDAPAQKAAAPPYPPSPVIRSIRWAPAGTIVRMARGSDNWPLAWADDGALYGAYGDGHGFEPFVAEKLSLGLARITGEPPNLRGENLRAPSLEQIGEGPRGRKASGMIAVDGVIYLLARNAGNSQLAWSTNHGREWSWADWKFTTSFGCPTFLSFGRDYTGARDEFVYVYSPDADSAYDAADRMVLARVSRGRIRDRGAYEFFNGLDSRHAPLWTKEIARRGAVFAHAGRCYRSGISYNAGLKRYLWCQILPGGDPRFAGGFGIYDAPEPWGPWTTAFYTESWDVGPGESASLPPKWTSHDGRRMQLAFSGDDCFSVRRADVEQFQSSADYFPPPESQGGWRKLEAADEVRRTGGMDPAKLAELKQWLLKSDDRDFAAVVIRHGYVVLEVERGNSAKTDARRVASVSKAVCATVLSIASERSQQGLTPRKMKFDDLAFDFIPWAKPLSDPRKAKITVKQLLNHTSGLPPESTGARNGGPWEYVFGHTEDPKTEKLAFDPGTDLGYSTHGFYHAALVCEDVTGKPYDRFAIEALFKPIGIEKWTFGSFDGGGTIGRHPNHELGMPARELARIAYCMLRGGRWNDRQVIPKWFVEETAAPTHSVKGIKSFGRDAECWSHGWELPARLTDGRSKGIPADARFKPGSGGQLIAFVPSLDLVITRQTGSSGDWAYEEYLRRACGAVEPD